MKKDLKVFNPVQCAYATDRINSRLSENRKDKGKLLKNENPEVCPWLPERPGANFKIMTDFEKGFMFGYFMGIILMCMMVLLIIVD